MHTFLSSLAPPKQNKIETMMLKCSFLDAVGKESRYNLLNVTETLYIPCILEGTTFASFGRKVCTGAPKSRLLGGILLPCTPLLATFCNNVCRFWGGMQHMWSPLGFQWILCARGSPSVLPAAYARHLPGAGKTAFGPPGEQFRPDETSIQQSWGRYR